MQVLSLSSSSCSVKLRVVKASWDTQQRLPYNRNAPRKLKNNTLTQSQSLSPTQPAPSTISTRKEQYISDILKRATPLPIISIYSYSLISQARHIICFYWLQIFQLLICVV